MLWSAGNFLVLRTQGLFKRIHGGNIKKWVLMGGVIGGICGLLGLMQPSAVGGGFNLIPIVAAGISPSVCCCLSLLPAW